MLLHLEFKLDRNAKEETYTQVHAPKWVPLKFKSNGGAKPITDNEPWNAHRVALVDNRKSEEGDVEEVMVYTQ